MVDKLKLEFNGSFQCRLATDPAPTTDSPKDPATDLGWTFAYSETRFDRIIRLSSPVSLRSALVDPWRDAKVSKVWVDSGTGLKVDNTTGLDGQIVSLGNAKFDSAAGAGTTKEALLNFAFSVGTLLKADAINPPQSPGVAVTASWSTDYKTIKPSKVSAAHMDPKRKAHMSSAGPIDSYAVFFQMGGKYPDTKLTNVRLTAGRGPLTSITDTTKYKWTLNMEFYRFDGDTLTGQIKGDLLAERKP